MRTLTPIPEGARVCLFWGELRCERSRSHNFAIRVQDGGDEFFIDPSSKGNVGRSSWINHSRAGANLRASLERTTGGVTPRIIFHATGAGDPGTGRAALARVWEYEQPENLTASRLRTNVPIWKQV